MHKFANVMSNERRGGDYIYKYRSIIHSLNSSFVHKWLTSRQVINLLDYI